MGHIVIQNETFNLMKNAFEETSPARGREV